MDTVKRRISELIELYRLEPELRDVYVEGISDRSIIESFFEVHDISNVSIYEIDTIDFSELYEKSPELKRNNKAKTICLCNQINDAHSDSIKFVVGLVDRDFDDLLRIKYKNPYLLLTDFTCFEMYFLDDDCINSFYKKILHTFPFNAKTTIKELSDPLKELFLMRYLFKCLFKNKECKFIDLKKLCNINKKTGKIGFNQSEYLNRMLNKIGEYKEKENCQKFIKKSRANLKPEIRHQIRGHDFTHLFFAYINKIKNNIQINKETFERVLPLCANYEKLSDYRLFSTLLKKYS